MHKNVKSAAGFALALGACASFYVGCSHFAQYRAPANYGGPTAVPISPKLQSVLEQDVRNYGGRIEFPEGLTGSEALELWHLSEGSDIIPLKWFLNLKSQTSILPDTPMNDRLYEKFGVMAVPPNMLAKSPFPMKWIGLTAAWSGMHPQRADVRVQPGTNPIAYTGVRKDDQGRESIAMVGTNCAFCHTGSVTLNGKDTLFEGAPNMLAIRGFFQDLYGSTAKTMLTPELLAQFLTDNGVAGDTRAMAAQFASELRRDLGVDKEVILKIEGLFFMLRNRNLSKENAAKHIKKDKVYEGRPVMQAYLERLLKMTYGLRELTPELKLRMKFLSVSMGQDPKIEATPEGYARTDAFGRIANLVARFKKPANLTATTSVPPMWNIKHKAMYHWNANTNSVIMRNIGQSFGLGSILTNPDGIGGSAYDATSNIHNIRRIEQLLYKVQAPNWADIDAPIDHQKVKLGCELYHNEAKCASCHTPFRERVGPSKSLVLERLIPMDVTKTDATYTINQSEPVDGVAFKDALFGFTGRVRDRYYERYQVPEALRHEWESADIRGAEFFRDTYLGEDSHAADSDSAYLNIKESKASSRWPVPASPTPGYPAKQLSSVWATAPYLHNGSVANMYELLKPAKERRRIFFVGSRELDTKNLGFRSDFNTLPQIPDLEARAQKIFREDKNRLELEMGVPMPVPHNMEEARIHAACSVYPARCFFVDQKGNSNAGHEFGTNLTDDQRYQLIEFLKVIRAEPEYSRNLEPVYSWNPEAKTCEVY